MSEFKGTPKPWGIQDDHGKRWIEALDGKTICEIHRQSRQRANGSKVGADNDTEFHANANLIAAAPDLLKACKDLLQHASLTEHMSACSVERARAAIAKALGGQS